jgi:hypothetical protein
MIVYIVFGIEWHASRELLRIFDNYDKALEFKELQKMNNKTFDDFKIVPYTLNEPYDTL